MIQYVVYAPDPIFAGMLEGQISLLLAGYPERLDCRVCVCSSERELLELSRTLKIHVLLFDVDRPGQDPSPDLPDSAGPLSERLPDTLLIFVTAREERMYRLLCHRPFGILRKSTLSADLPALLKSAADLLTDRRAVRYFDSVDGEIMLRLPDILWLESVRNYYDAHCDGQTFRCRGTLIQAQSLISDPAFFRIHSAYLVNMSRIRTLSPRVVTLDDGTPLPVSQRRWPPFRLAYGRFVRG